MNVRDAPLSQVLKNEEIVNLIKILGLDFKRSYARHSNDPELLLEQREGQGEGGGGMSRLSGKGRGELRYGRVMIMADQDHDGSHIKGLVLNLFHHFWPALMEKVSTSWPTQQTEQSRETKANKLTI